MSRVPIQPTDMDGVDYHEYVPGVYYSPVAPMQPADTASFNSSFSSQPEFVVTPYSSTTSFDSMDGPAHANRSFSESFGHQPTESFNAPSSRPQHNAIAMAQVPRTPPVTTKFPAVPISPSQIAPRQKAKRTPTACEECRKRKQKCDGETPCQACKEQKLTCRYREVSPTKKDNTIERMLHVIEAYGKSLTSLAERLDAVASTLAQIERRLTRCGNCGSSVELSSGDCHECECGRIPWAMAKM